MDFASVATVLARQFSEQQVQQLDALKRESEIERTAQNEVSTAVDSESFNETGSKVAVQPTGQILSEQA